MKFEIWVCFIMMAVSILNGSPLIVSTALFLAGSMFIAATRIIEAIEK